MMKKLTPYLAVLVIPIGAALFLAANRADEKPAPREDTVSITQKHEFSAMAGQKGKAQAEPGKPAKLRIGDEEPNLGFTALDGQSYTVADWRGKLPLIVLADTTCPCVKAYEKRMKALTEKFPDLRVAYVFPSPMESRAQVEKFVKSRGYAWPVAFDADQTIMGALGGSCTTESFLFDREGKLRYHGRIDDNIYDEPNVKVRDLQNAIQSIVDGKTFVKSEVPAYGCVIPQRSQDGMSKTGKGKNT